MFKKVVLSVGILYLNGCGGGSGNSYSNVSNQEVSKTIEMAKGKVYNINSGDKLHKLESNSRIKIKGNIKNNTSTVELLSGRVTIERK